MINKILFEEVQKRVECGDGDKSFIDPKIRSYMEGRLFS